jgi:hypothetical protein
MDPNKGRGIMKLRSFASSYLVAVVLGVAGMPAALQAASRIGLYTDQTGSSCSFSGNAPGLVTAYVVVHPDPNGVRALRFSAPLPACFGATFLYETPPGGAPVTGSSPTGVQIAFPSCAPYPEPTLALTITYYRNGSTTPCCAFPIEPDPLVGSIEVTDCSFQAGTMTSTVSRFNADETCPCVDPTKPLPPINPNPADAATNVSLTALLTWGKNPLDIDVASFDVYFGTSTTPPLVANVSQGSYQPPSFLDTSTTYYWRIRVNDSEGNSTLGPLWSFTTVVSNSPPNEPNTPVPASGTTSISVTPTLSWSASDPNNDPLKYDVYLGPTPNPVLISSNLVPKTYTPAVLAFDTDYSWYIVARDALCSETVGPTWTFRTRLQNYPPNVPTLLAPADGATFLPKQITLQWSGGDPDNNLSNYSLYVGTANPPAFYATTGNTGATITFNAGTLYYWYVVARDAFNATATSAVWSFRTNAIPAEPSNPSPPYYAQDQPLNMTLTWESSDADGEALKYDVYAGSSIVPPLRASNVTSSSFNVSNLTNPDQDFFWKIVVKDNHGASVTGPLWYFHTKPNSAPDQAFNPTPANNVYFNSNLLTWDASDVDAPPQVLLYDVRFGTTNPPPQVEWFEDQKSYNPGTLQPGTRYYWAVDVWDGHVYTYGDLWTFVAGQPTATSELPTVLALGRNHPNPFNPQTIIPYTIPKGAPLHVRMTVFDATGRLVRVLVDETQSAGAREVVWRGENEAGAVVSSGIYYCVMDAGRKRFTQKLVLLK